MNGWHFFQAPILVLKHEVDLHYVRHVQVLNGTGLTHGLIRAYNDLIYNIKCTATVQMSVAEIAQCPKTNLQILTESTITCMLWQKVKYVPRFLMMDTIWSGKPIVRITIFFISPT